VDYEGHHIVTLTYLRVGRDSGVDLCGVAADEQIIEVLHLLLRVNQLLPLETQLGGDLGLALS
jgi:hypothetical protein